MASIRRQGSRCEIRECLRTERGPRQRVLARFDRVLTSEALDRAAAAARRPFDREAVVACARRGGIPVEPRPRHAEARQLLADLRAGARLDPTLVAQLQQALALQPAAELPEHLHGVSEWLGRSEAARGRALRGLLRTASRVVRSRAPLKPLPEERFPHFRSRPEPA